MRIREKVPQPAPQFEVVEEVKTSTVVELPPENQNEIREYTQAADPAR